jgi:ABC-2 type transport system ATP-binding protein
MTKRLAVARGLLGESPLLLVDEATHDLDIEGSRTIRALFRDLAERGSTIVWSTQRLEELPGLVDTVTVLDRGAVRFDGSLDDLVASVDRPVYRVAVRHEEGAAHSAEFAAAALGESASVVGGSGHLLSIRLAATSELGAALRKLMDAGFEVLTCHEESGAIERAVEMRLGS